VRKFEEKYGAIRVYDAGLKTLGSRLPWGRAVGFAMESYFVTLSLSHSLALSFFHSLSHFPGSVQFVSLLTPQGVGSEFRVQGLGFRACGSGEGCRFPGVWIVRRDPRVRCGLET
jgi:hypothetical protein